MLRGNKGEWSEIYTLLKLLGEGHLCLGDGNLEKVEGVIYPIVKVLRQEAGEQFEYALDQNLVIISSQGEALLRIPIVTFKMEAIQLLAAIRSTEGSSFAVAETEKFMQQIRCSSLKAKSSSKTDIRIMIHDELTNQTPILGFSVKSKLGSPSTLLNAGKTTNFTYQVKGCDLSLREVKAINALTGKCKLKDRLVAVLEKGGWFDFQAVENPIFSSNLILMDSLLPKILAVMVLDYYSSERTSMLELLSHVEALNPICFDASHGHLFYQYKIKRFLTDIALGMMPSKVWTGEYDATGGYLVVKESGDILCYHLFNRNAFEDYLLNHTKLDTASSSRHDFGALFEKEGVLYMKLNLQIRFI